MSDGYNGWSNYETWNVKLWMDNDGSDSYWTERAGELLSDNSGDKESAASDLADEIKAAHQEQMPEVSGTFADLLQSALDSVDWREIAESILADVEIEDDDEDEETTDETEGA